MEKKWKPPEYIYLQIEDEYGNLADDAWTSEIYWCDEQIYESDIKYRKVVDDERVDDDNS